MKVLKFDVEVPHWCSFKQFGTVNLQLTYPFPPPPTLFGMIQNAMGKTQKDYRGYEKLKFAIIVRHGGEKLDDYSNIMKGNRERESSRDALKSELSSALKKKLKEEKSLDDKRIKEILKKYKEKSLDEPTAKELNTFEKSFWKEKIGRFGAYAIEKKWMRTQVMRQKLINPKYTIFLKSEDVSEYSLENISKVLRNPKRPLYIGESDDLVVIKINGDGLMDIDDGGLRSSRIISVIPGIHANSHIVKIPYGTRDKYLAGEKGSIAVSIPAGDVKKPISCLSANGENIVFL